MITGTILKDLAHFYKNTDRDTLEAVGLIQKGPSGDTGWKRFNHDFDIFILKLSDEKREELATLINAYFASINPPDPDKLEALLTGAAVA